MLSDENLMYLNTSQRLQFSLSLGISYRSFILLFRVVLFHSHYSSKKVNLHLHKVQKLLNIRISVSLAALAVVVVHLQM